jgi:hypothetical protein
MIRYLAVIRQHHMGKVLKVDSSNIRQVWPHETASGSKVIGEYHNADIARRHMLLALEAYRPRSERRQA